MSLKKKSLKSLREGHEENLPVHPSDAGNEVPDSLDKRGARPIKPELDGRKVANDSAQHGGKAGIQLPEEEAEKEPLVRAQAEEDLPVHPSDAAEQLPSKEELKAIRKEEKEEDEEELEEEKEEGEEDKEEEKKLKEEKDEEEGCDKLEEEKDDEEEELSDEEKAKVKEDVEALTSGENLPESFKKKAAAIFEAAVQRTAKKKIEANKKKILDAYNKKLSEKSKAISESLIDKVDGYLDYVVEEWMKENEVAIETGLKNELTERFILGLKELFENHFIEVPATKADILVEQEKKISGLEKELNDEIKKVVELRKENAQLKKESIVKKLSEGLTVSDAAKFKELCEGVSFESAEAFSQKLNVIKETYFPKAQAPKSGDLDASLLIEGGLKVEEPKSSPKDDMDIYAETLSRILKR